MVNIKGDENLIMENERNMMEIDQDIQNDTYETRKEISNSHEIINTQMQISKNEIIYNETVIDKGVYEKLTDIKEETRSCNEKLITFENKFERMQNNVMDDLERIENDVTSSIKKNNTKVI
jgi:hypothetical protein